ncbi:MAG: TAXI family TRAP transporter solute-binding subunit [Xanthobacteraceae bacterium]|nr:TAXI family TRAP transporter solute-binding subunit [Xanthobacteraceae bacterium]
MSKMRKLYTFAASATAIAAVLAVSALQPAATEERKSLRLATSSVDSYGYKIAASLVKVIEEALGGEYTVTVQPYTSPTVGMKAVMNGDGEIAYTADIGMTQLYKAEAGFQNYTPVKPKIVHSWYAYPMESMMAATVKEAEKIKCWKDLSGKPVFYTTAGFQNWHNWVRIYKALGYQFKHVQIDTKSNSDALLAGTVVASATYTTAGRSLAPYWKETEIRMDIRVINPCPDEIAKLKAAGLAVVDVEAKDVFTKDVGPKILKGVPILFGYNVGTNISEDIVYKLLNAFYKKKDELAKIDPGFTPMAKDFIGMQVAGINANPDIPVHPGMAKFLKEHKAWNDKWKIAGSAS